MLVLCSVNLGLLCCTIKVHHRPIHSRYRLHRLNSLSLSTAICVYAYIRIDRYCCVETTLLYKNNTGGEGLVVLCDVVGAATVYKIVKKDYIALQCKSLKLKEEINRDRVDNKGTESRTESAHTKWTMSQGCGNQSSLWSPAP